MSEGEVCGEVLGTGGSWHGQTTYRCQSCGATWAGQFPRSEVMLLQETKQWQEARATQLRRERDNKLLAAGLIDRETKDRLESLRSM